MWRLFCRLGWCPCAPYEDDGGCGGQCTRCGKIVGYVTRAELRAYADRVVTRIAGKSTAHRPRT